MGLKNFFLEKVTRVTTEQKKEIKETLWSKCDACGEISYKQEIDRLLNTCPACGYHFKISARQKINIIIDEGSFDPIDGDLVALDPLKFKDTKKYTDRVKTAQKNTGLNDAFVACRATIAGKPVNVGAIEFDFMGGSMGSVVGESIVRLVEDAISRRCHVIIFSASGGARMQEGMLSLMQMAKTSAAIARLHKHNLGYISILTNPTTGGVSASFSMLGDVNIGEPGALIGFAGARVIEQTIRQKLPEGFQSAEFLLGHGMLDAIVHRVKMRETVINFLKFFG